MKFESYMSLEINYPQFIKR